MLEIVRAVLECSGHVCGNLQVPLRFNETSLRTVHHMSSFIFVSIVSA